VSRECQQARAEFISDTPIRFIAILLVIFELNAEQVLDEFIELSVNVLEKRGIDAEARTTALKTYIEGLLEKYGIEKERRLVDSSGHNNDCKL
jgi:hypothetical protein